jgi:hypothetical protein
MAFGENLPLFIHTSLWVTIYRNAANTLGMRSYSSPSRLPEER